jgi:hypothetical protein
MKVVINTGSWGVYLSDKAIEFLKLVKEDYIKFEEDRSNQDLIRCIESLGNDAGMFKHDIFKIIDIPDDVKYEICERDCGGEYIREISRMWC